MDCWHLRITLRFGLWDCLGPWEVGRDRVLKENR